MKMTAHVNSILASAAIVLALTASLLPGPAQAQFVCAGSLDGSAPQTGAGGNAAGSAGNFACGANASSFGSSGNSAVGNSANAAGTFSSNTAVGNAANASGTASANTALGAEANAAGPAGSGPTFNTAIGYQASASGLGRGTAVGSPVECERHQ
jgi:hypothetical protein